MLKFQVRTNKEIEGSLTSVTQANKEAVIEFDDFDVDGNELYEVASGTDVSGVLDTSDGVIEYHARRQHDEDWIEENYFSSVETEEMGYKVFIPIFDPAANGWGVDVVMLSGRELAYRSTNPMNDGEWSVGDLEDIADTLNAVEYSWYTFKFDGENMKFTVSA